MNETPYDKLTRKEKLQWLADELSSCEAQMEHLENYAIPKAVNKLKGLKPTKKEIDEHYLDDFLNMYQ